MTETQSLGLGSKGPDPKPRLLRESVVIAITVLLGGLAIAAVASHYAGGLSDVVRLAVPPPSRLDSTA